MNKFVCIAGLTGSGKSIVSDMFVKKGYSYVRFGQVVLDEVKKRGLSPTEDNERPIREEIRKVHGMAGIAILNLPRFREMLEKGNVIADGLYSWSEYKFLKEEFNESLVVIAVFAPPETRYARLEKRTLSADDKDLRQRPATRENAIKRDYAEIENLEKGGPIAMADYTIVNTGSMEDLEKAVNAVQIDLESKLK